MVLRTSKRIRRPLLFMLALCLLLALEALPALAAQGTNESIDITGIFEVNECTGEPVVLDGRVHLLTAVTANADGSFHVKQHINTQGVTGIGVISGDSYSFNQEDNFMGEVDVPAGGSGHLVGHQEFIHHGESRGVTNPALDDKHVHFNTTVALDASGQPTTTFTTRIECK
jgi:hypothetical protein